MPKKIQNPNFEDTTDILFSAMEDVYHGKLSIQKAKAVHLVANDMHQNHQAGYRAQLNSYKNPSTRYYRKKPPVPKDGTSPEAKQLAKEDRKRGPGRPRKVA